MMFSITKQEIYDIIISDLIISISFSILFSKDVFSVFPLMFVVSTFSFVVHELGHKFTAQYFGQKAVFRKNNFMLILMFVMSFFGFIIAAPGYVETHSTKKIGLIALAGPFMNLIMIIISFFFRNTLLIFNFLFNINIILFFFNMLPFPMFDGYTVMKHNKYLFYVFFVLASFLWFFSIVV